MAWEKIYEMCILMTYFASILLFFFFLDTRQNSLTRKMQEATKSAPAQLLSRP